MVCTFRVVWCTSVLVAAAAALAEALSGGLNAAPSSRAEAGTLHVSPTGDDAAEGTAAAPFRTVQRAAEAAQPGDTVLVAPGVYRERVAPPRGGVAGQPIVFRSAERHRAVIKGSDEWRPRWRQETASIWSGAVDPGLFTDTSHVDGANPFEIPLSSTPWGREGRPEHERHVRKEHGGVPGADPDLVYSLGQVFVDGALLRQAATRPEMEAQPGAWWYDRSDRRLCVHFTGDGLKPGTPDRRFVEIATRRRIFAPHERGLGHIEIDGFVFEHCGNQYPTNFWTEEHPAWQQAGAVGTRCGHHWKIHHNIIRLAGSVGLDLGKEGHPATDLEIGGRRQPGGVGHHVVEDNWILDNGCAGTAGYLATNLVLRRNVVMGNNRLRFTGAKRWENGGIKLHGPHDSVIEGNFVAHNFDRWGIWLDGGPGRNTRVIRNVVIGHGVGIDFEVGSPQPGHEALIADNVLVDNDVGISFRECGGTDVLHNLVVGAGKAAIECTVNASRSGGWSAERIGIFGNVLSGTGQLVKVTGPDSPRSVGRRFDGNLYGAKPDAIAWSVTGKAAQTLGLDAWRTFWEKANRGSAGDTANAAADAASTAGGLVEHFYDAATKELVLRIDSKAPFPTVAADERVATDFFGMPFTRDAAAHSAGQASATDTTGPAPIPPGPFAGLEPGGGRFRLWSGPWPE